MPAVTDIRVIDCIIVGFHSQASDELLQRVESMQTASGAYRNMRYNFVHYRGRLLTYMQLASQLLLETAGIDRQLHPMCSPSLAACYLKSFLDRRGFRVEIINQFDADRRRLEQLLEQNPRTVAISTTFYTEPFPVAEVVAFIRKHAPRTRIVAAGPFIQELTRYSLHAQDYVLKNIGADIYIDDAQGELTLSRLLEELRRHSPNPDFSAIPNLVVRLWPDDQPPESSLPDPGPLRPRSVFQRTRREQEANDINTELIDWPGLLSRFHWPFVPIWTSRGCPFQCAFCRYPLSAGKWQLKREEVVVGEMSRLHDAGIRILGVVDDNMNVPLNRFKSVLRAMIKHQFGFDWFCFFRSSHADTETFDLLAESGCRGVFLGIESGSQPMLDCMNKQATVEQYRSAIRELNCRNILTHVSLIVGFPGECAQTVQDTIEFLQQVRPTLYRAEIYHHNEAVPIQADSARLGLRGAGYSWRHNTMSWQEACDWIDRIHASVTESTWCPLYEFDFWSIPYLLGLGWSIPMICEFLRHAQTLNAGPHLQCSNTKQDTAIQGLLRVTQAWADNLAVQNCFLDNQTGPT